MVYCVKGFGKIEKYTVCLFSTELLILVTIVDIANSVDLCFLKSKLIFIQDTVISNKFCDSCMH